MKGDIDQFGTRIVSFHIPSPYLQELLPFYTGWTLLSIPGGSIDKQSLSSEGVPVSASRAFKVHLPWR